MAETYSDMCNDHIFTLWFTAAILCHSSLISRACHYSVEHCDCVQNSMATWHVIIYSSPSEKWILCVACKSNAEGIGYNSVMVLLWYAIFIQYLEYKKANIFHWTHYSRVLLIWTRWYHALYELVTWSPGHNS